MKKIKALLKSMNSFVAKIYPIVFLVEGIIIFACFGFSSYCLYNFFSMISIGASLFCSIRLFEWKFGDTPFIRGDIFAGRYVKEGRMEEFRKNCLETATISLLVSFIFFVGGIIFHFAAC